MSLKEIIKLLRYFVVLICLSTQADTFELTPNLYHFNYEEFNTVDSSLDKEVGFLPGIKFKYSKEINDVLYSPYLTYNSGTVDYIGHTQTGVPHNTETIEEILTIGLDVEIELNSKLSTGLIFGFRSWLWDRDILTINNVRGLHELYSWNELSVGMSFNTEKINNTFFTTKVSILRLFSPQMKIYLENSSETLDLGESNGFRFMFGKTWLRKNKSMTLSFLAEYWEFGRSNTVFTNDFFGSSVFVTEPRSESFHTGIELNYRFNL